MESEVDEQHFRSYQFVVIRDFWKNIILNKVEKKKKNSLLPWSKRKKKGNCMINCGKLCTCFSLLTWFNINIHMIKENQPERTKNCLEQEQKKKKNVPQYCDEWHSKNPNNKKKGKKKNQRKEIVASSRFLFKRIVRHHIKKSTAVTTANSQENHFKIKMWIQNVIWVFCFLFHVPSNIHFNIASKLFV